MKQVTIKTAKKDEITIGIDENGVYIQCKGTWNFYLNSFEIETICRIMENLGWSEEINENVREQEPIIRETPKLICESCGCISCICNSKED